MANQKTIDSPKLFLKIDPNIHQSMLATNPLTRTNISILKSLSSQDQNIQPHRVLQKSSPKHTKSKQKQNINKTSTERQSKRSQLVQSLSLAPSKLLTPSLSLAPQQSLLEKYITERIQQSPENQIGINGIDRKFVKIRFISPSLQGKLQTSSTHVREFKPSPKRQVTYLRALADGTELQRKVKILQGRIMQLHRQKQAQALRINKDDHIFIRQNMNLKNKIKELQNVIESKIKMADHENMYQSCDKNQSSDFTKEMLQTENTNSRKKLNDEIQNLKEEMSNLEELLATEIGKSMELYEKLSFEQKKVNSLSQAAEMHEKVLAEKEEAIEQLSKRVSVYEQNNVQFQSDLKVIKQSMQDNERRHVEIISQYQQKLREKTAALNNIVSKNQQLQAKIVILQTQMSISDMCNTQIEQIEVESEEILKENVQNVREQENILESKEKEIVKLIKQLTLLKETSQVNQRQLSQYKFSKQQQLARLKQSLSKIQQQNTILSQKCKQLAQVTMQGQQGRGRTKKWNQLLKTVIRLNNQLNGKNK